MFRSRPLSVLTGPEPFPARITKPDAPTGSRSASMRPPPGGRRIFRILCITGFEKSESQIRTRRDEMSAASQFQPLRNIQDIEELERVPLEQRLLSWDVNDWIRHGCDLAPQKVAIRYVEDGNPESP